MDFILRLVFIVLAINAAILLAMVSYYLKVGRHQKITVDFEEYIASLPKNAPIFDPYIIVDGKWVKTDTACQNPSPKT